MSGLSPIKNIAELRRMARAFAVVSAWSSAGVLARLADGQMHDINRLPGDERALRQTGPLLERLGLIVQNGGQIALSALGRQLLSCGALAASFREVRELALLDSALVSGSPVAETEGGVSRDERQRTVEFLSALHDRSRHLFHWVAQEICQDLSGSAHVLDLGGGHGGYAAAVVAAGVDRGVCATVFDRDICIEFARGKYGNSLRYRVGNFEDDDLGGPYDLVLMANVLHGLGPTSAAHLITRARHTLKPQGKLAIFDIFRHMSAHTDGTALLDLTMFMTSREGRCYEVDECSRILQRRGFVVRRVVSLPDSDCAYVLSTQRHADQ